MRFVNLEVFGLSYFDQDKNFILNLNLYLFALLVNLEVFSSFCLVSNKFRNIPCVGFSVNNKMRFLLRCELQVIQIAD